ncbi:hypothetical protein CBW65_06270 [Tumebacillus avium]|uniref:HTH luxR-type domain-containing protein n=1 Tax=Tumebacillus avium TaxID=1903704 RepID=A0A1Y0ILN1_9BACL|nr:LuxR C-terminal-related transcriptional regulator [Tumebacillus avium]ARU60736.1 hypothetical protein CBW65_06270 [Tumebacillus avium]
MLNSFEPAPNPLLSTKLYIPHQPLYHVTRERLLAKLADALQCKLTVVTAPPGFGKTTLVSDWVRQQDVAAAWVSLDKGENDLLRFWNYVIAALDPLMPGLEKKASGLLQPSMTYAIEGLLVWLVNQLFQLDHDVVLVLDDCHVLQSDEVHRSLSFFLERLPKQAHVCLISRQEPPIPLGALRAKGQLLAVEITDIKFTEDEMKSYWSLQTGAPPSDDDMRLLAERTEGWAAGIQLAVVSQRAGQSAALHHFSGNHRFVVDYLMEEVFLHLPDAVRSFLLRTSILSRMNGELCAAVTLDGDAESLLRQIGQANLFLIPLDGSHYWFRYHHLFADFLSSRLQQEFSKETALLHERASLWYEGQGLIEEAIHHALAAGSYERASGLIQRIVSSLFKRRVLTTLYGWLQQLPEEVAARPEVLLIQAWTELLMGKYDRMPRHLAQLHAAMAALAETGDPLLLRMGEEVQIIENFHALITRNFDLAIELIDRLYARDDIPEQDSLPLLLSLGIELNEGSVPFIRGYYGFDGRIELAWRHHGIYDAFLSKNGLQGFSYSAFQRAAMSELCYERGELEQALQFAEAALLLAKPVKLIGAYVPAVIVTANILRAQGDAAGADGAMQEAFTYLRDNDSLDSHWHGALSAARTRFELAKGNLEPVRRWVVEAEKTLRPDQAYETLTYIRALAATGRSAEALTLAEALLKTARQQSSLMTELEALLCLAALAHRQGNDHDAMLRLHEALTLGEQQGYLRTPAVAAHEEEALFRRYAEVRKKRHMPELQTGVSFNYFNRVLLTAGMQAAPAPDAPPVHTLTARELEVLHLLATGRTNKEIAAALVLTEGTVKLHLNRIYSKLLAKGRVQAIQKAKEQRLLKP